jgi:hypothetical protein
LVVAFAAGSGSHVLPTFAAIVSSLSDFAKGNQKTNNYVICNTVSLAL